MFPRSHLLVVEADVTLSSTTSTSSASAAIILVTPAGHVARKLLAPPVVPGLVVVDPRAIPGANSDLVWGKQRSPFGALEIQMRSDPELLRRTQRCWGLLRRRHLNSGGALGNSVPERIAVLDRRDVAEHVLSAIIRLDKPESSFVPSYGGAGELHPKTKHAQNNAVEHMLTFRCSFHG